MYMKLRLSKLPHCLLVERSPNPAVYYISILNPPFQAPKISLSGSDPSDHALRLRQFRQFVSVFRRHYASNFELRSRFEAFKSNMEKKEHYEAKETGTAQYGMTEFMDYEGKNSFTEWRGSWIFFLLNFMFYVGR